MLNPGIGFDAAKKLWQPAQTKHMRAAPQNFYNTHGFFAEHRQLQRILQVDTGLRIEEDPLAFFGGCVLYFYLK